MGITVWKDRIFVLQTKNSMYVMEQDHRGLLRHLYWGCRAGSGTDFEELPEEEWENSYHPFADKTMEEYAPFGGLRYKETALKLEYSDGTKDFRYRVEGYETAQNSLFIRLKDIFYPCAVTLSYEVFEEEDIIRRCVSIRNEGEAPILLERLYSAQFGLPGVGYQSINFNGSWAAEFQRREDAVTAGKMVYESLRGSTAHVANPCFILHRRADEQKGGVYFGLLAYSGNFKVVAEATPYDYTNVLIGMSDTDFAWELKSGEALEAPDVYCGYSAEGLGGMSGRLHRLEKEHLMPEPFAGRELPVLYNSWYATYFDVRCEEQKKLAKKAADIGVELFVVDDGWFKGRADDTKGLGDWWVDRDKFPNGLSELIDYVKGLGMRFGIWIEPEMVNEDSELYRTHPEWVYRYENRKILKGRSQYVLDLTREEVAEFMIGALDRLLSEHDISYIKWDMNRAIAETGVRGRTSVERKQSWLLHMRNFYRVVEEIRKRHPEVEFEACASGGGRVDLGAMRHFDEYWPSDNTDPLDRLSIQESYSLLYPAKYMRAWVTDAGQEETARKAPLTFALHVAMCGSLGIGNNLNGLKESELALIAQQISLYKRIRHTIQFGELYRLKSLEKDGLQAVQYTEGQKSVIFVFLAHGRYGKNSWRLQVRELESESFYQVRIQGRTLRKSGAFLMHYGLEVTLAGDYDSCVILMNAE